MPRRATFPKRARSFRLGPWTWPRPKRLPRPRPTRKVGRSPPGKGANILRHFISSVGPDEKPPKAMAEAIRAHWGCETRHWERDQVWCEDKCLMRSPNAACALAMLRVATKAVLVGVGERSVTLAIEKARESTNLAISWIKEHNLGG